MNLLSAERESALAARAREVRELTLKAIHHVQTGHPGSSLSMVELLTYLYFSWLRIRPEEPGWRGRDFFILSKGHGAPSYYAALAIRGFLPREELYTLRQLGSRLQGHPNAHDLPAVDASTGSLGQGLSIAVGLALGLKHQQRPNRVVCVLGDGELQEGQIWEAAMTAAARSLDNLTVVIDRNGLQNDGPTEDIVALDDLEAKWSAFKFQTMTADGHDFAQLHQAFARAGTEGRPTAIIARTIKGRGVSFMEGVTHWHHHPISDGELEQALVEIARGAA
ncbi:MAG TPA: transketolase [Thermoanaerobaculia bacterium]|jgi:transketolase|nr:transketolase [Thermoanaerobaculia bacterium]